MKLNLLSNQGRVPVPTTYRIHALPEPPLGTVLHRLRPFLSFLFTVSMKTSYLTLDVEPLLKP